MRMTTKGLCLVLSLGMAAGMLPVSVLAEATPETAAVYEQTAETAYSVMSLSLDSENPDNVPAGPADPRTVQAVEVEGLGKYASLTEALTAIAAGEADSYTITLLEDATLKATGKEGVRQLTELPAKALVIDGNGHTLTAPDTKKDCVVAAYAGLTLRNVKMNASRMILENRTDGAVLTLESSVTGSVEKIGDEASQGGTLVIQAPADGKNVVGTVTGSGKSKTGEVILTGFGSQEEPTADCPSIGSTSDKDKPGKLILENSWIVTGANVKNSAANWGNVVIRTAGGMAVTGSQQAASPASWTVEEGTVADLYLKKMSSGFSYLTINSLGAVSGKTQIHIVGDTMPTAGDALVKIKGTGAQLDSFVLAEDATSRLEGMALLPDASGNYTIRSASVEDPAVTVSGGAFGSGVQFASWEAAAELLNQAAGSTEYTLTLHSDLTLPAGTVLPDLALTIDGGGHALAMDEGGTLQVRNSLTLQKVNLGMKGASIEYVRASNGEKTLTFAESVTGTVGSIADRSQSRWLDIRVESTSLTFDKIIGTTSTIGTRLTDLILTNVGSRENPVDLQGKVENLAALELNNSWVTASGDATALGYIRTDYTKTENETRTGGLVLTGSTTLQKISVTDQDDFELWMPADATLTVQNKYSTMNRQVPVYVQGTLQDGHVLVAAPGNSSKKTADYRLANGPEGALLYWDKGELQYKVSFAPEIAMAEDAVSYRDYYTTVSLQLQDGQGIASVTVNGVEAELTGGIFVPDPALLVVGENTVAVTDVTGNTAAFTFRYDTPADYSGVEEALAAVPADLSSYTAQSAQAVRDAAASVVYGAGSSSQADVDAMAQAIRAAVAGLTKSETTGTQQSGSGSQTVTVTENKNHSGSGQTAADSGEASDSKTVQPVRQATVPQTGDAENVALWLTLMLVSLAGLAGLSLRAVRRRRK